MGRIKRGYVREIPTDELKRDYRLFAIACEGSKREKEYFRQLEGISRRVVVEYINDEEYEDNPPSSPDHVLRRAREYADKTNLNEEDSIWLLYHTTDHLDHLSTKTSRDCKTSLDARTPEGYNPERYIVLIREATANAKAADKSTGWFPEHNHTKMYVLVESLMKFVSPKEFDAFIERKTRAAV